MNNRSTQIARSSVVIAAISGIGTLLSFLTQALLAAWFGVGISMDSFLIASTLPGLALAVFSGAVTFTFIPVFVEYRVRQEEEQAWRTANNLLQVAAVCLTLLGAGMLVGADVITKWTAPGLTAASHAEAAALLRVLVWSIPLSGMASLLSSLLYAERRFFAPAAASLVNTAVTYLVTLVTAKTHGIAAVAWATVAGSIANCVVVIILLRRKLLFSPRISLTDPAMLRVMKTMSPLLIGAIFYRANGLIERYIASGLPAGSISYLGYSAKLVSAIVGLVATGIPFVALSHYSELVAGGDLQGLGRTLRSNITALSILVMIIMTMLVVCGDDVIVVLFRRGEFTDSAVRATWAALVCYLGVFYASLIGTIVTPVFYSFKDTLTSVTIGVSGAVLQLLLSIPLSKWFSYLGLPVAYSISNCVTIAVFVLVLNVKYVALPLRQIAGTLARCLLVATGAAYLAWMCRDAFLRETTPLLRLIVIPVFLVVFFAALARLLIAKDFNRLVERLQQQILNRMRRS